jgi:hypothetical protein
MKIKRVLLSIASTSLLISLMGTSTARAATSPSVKWKLSTLKSSSSYQTSSVATTNSTGKKSWSVSGSCTLKNGKVITRSAGYCTIKLSIKAKGKFAARTFSKRFAIKKVVPTSPINTTLSGDFVILCQKFGSSFQLILIDVNSGTQRSIVTRKDPIFTYPQFSSECRISADLSREVGTNLSRVVQTRNVASGNISVLPYNVSTGGFNDAPAPFDKVSTICGAGQGIVYSLASDGWLYKEVGQGLSRYQDLSSFPVNSEENGAILDLLCIGSEPALAIKKSWEYDVNRDEKFQVIHRLNGGETSLNEIGGDCNLLDSRLGVCPTTGTGDFPTAFVRHGSNLYFVVSIQTGSYLWTCQDPTEFRSCNPSKVASVSPGAWETVGFLSGGLTNLLNVHP